MLEFQHDSLSRPMGDVTLSVYCGRNAAQIETLAVRDLEVIPRDETYNNPATI